MNEALIEHTMQACVKRGGNPGAKLHRAIQLQREMVTGKSDFATLADAFSIVDSWHGHVVTVDGQTWVVRLIDDSMVARQNNNTNP